VDAELPLTTPSDGSSRIGLDALKRAVEALPESPAERARVVGEWLAELQERTQTREGRGGRRRTRGVVYTPRRLTGFIVDQALGGELQRLEARLREEHALDRIPSRHVHRRRAAERAFWESYRDDVLVRLRVLDPACGSGAFLLAAYERLFTEYRRVNAALADLHGGQLSVFDLNRTILLRNLFGVDRSAEAVDITRLSLWLETAVLDRLPAPLEGNIVRGNAVVDDPAADSLALDWVERFPGVLGDGGFDVVVGNPPYVRQELLSPLKPYLKQAYASFDAAADLYTYFCEKALRLLRPGGVLCFVVANKWMRSGYGRALRRLFAEQAILEQVVDLGHASLFGDAEAFPCIVTLRKPGVPPNALSVDVCRVPGTQASRVDLPAFVAERAYRVPRGAFTEDAWSLEPPAARALLERIRGRCVPLGEFAGVKPYWGIKTGCNAAFLVDGAQREQLIQQDPRSAERIRPYLRGKDLGRWSAEATDTFLLFTRRGTEIDDYPAIRDHLATFRERLEPRPPGWDAAQRWPGRKPGSYRWFELQDAVDYWPLFEQPKILTQDLATHPRFALDRSGAFPANTCYVWPTTDLYLLGWLCSPLAWWIMHRTLQRGLHDTLRMFRAQVEILPIAEPAPPLRRAVEEVVEELVAQEHGPTAPRTIELERMLSSLICESHGLDPADVALMWKTAPPRMPSY